MFSFKSSHRRCSVKKVFLTFRKFDRKTPVLESLLNKVAGLEACNIIKKRLQHRYFPVKFAKFLRTPFWRISANDGFYSFLLTAPVLESLLNKFAILQICKFIKKRLQHRFFPVKFAKFLRTPMLKNICNQLLL